MVLARGQILGSQKGAARPHSGAGRAFLRCHSTCCIAANGRGERPAPGCAARRRLCAGGQLRPGGPTKPSRRSLGSGCRFGLSPSRQSATQPGCSHQRPVLPLGVDKEEEGQKEREREREREKERERKRKNTLFVHALLFVAQPFKSASQVVSGGKVHTGETGECTVWRCSTRSASDACVWTAVDPPEGLALPDNCIVVSWQGPANTFLAGGARAGM